MSKLSLIIAGSLALLSSTSVFAQMNSATSPEGARRIAITYDNTTTGQNFSPAVFFTHTSAAPPLFKLGEKASFELMRLSEEANISPAIAGAVMKLGSTYGDVVIALPATPGKNAKVEISVSKEFPFVSGAFMLGMTNDGFSGVNAINAYELKEPLSVELLAYDAGTENNNEKKGSLIAMMGTDRDPENGVIAKHTGIRGDADAPASWKFDTSKPVGRITFTPISAEMSQ